MTSDTADSHMKRGDEKRKEQTLLLFLFPGCEPPLQTQLAGGVFILSFFIPLFGVYAACVCLFNCRIYIPRTHKKRIRSTGKIYSPALLFPCIGKHRSCFFCRICNQGIMLIGTLVCGGTLPILLILILQKHYSAIPLPLDPVSSSSFTARGSDHH